jgi:phage terminase large subunit-like protein
MTAARRCLDFLASLRVPEGPRAGKPLRLAPFQRAFVKGALRPSTSVAALSIGRGNGKTALSAGIALAELLGHLERQPRRECLIAARSRDQAMTALNLAWGLASGLPDDIRERLQLRRAPRAEIEFHGDGGGHVLRAIAADGKNVLGGAPTLAILDERGHWPAGRGDELEAALLSGLGKRNGRALIISTSAADDSHPFSRWLDQPPPGAFVQEHRPAPGLPPDDMESLLLANPGARHGIGASPAWLKAQAELAIARGGSALLSFRLLNRNERVSGEARDLLLTVDEWLAVEVDPLPPRSGPVVIGCDLGGSASMSAAAFFWPQSCRLEVQAWFPSSPSLLNRGQADGVGDRYCLMQDRGELATLGDKTVPTALWFGEIMRRVEGQHVAAICADRYKASELQEAMAAAKIRAPVIWRGFGWRDGSEDCERFRRAIYDGQVRAAPSLLMRSALADAVVLRDPANNMKLVKGRSIGRIDAVSAAVIAIAEGARLQARPAPKPAVLHFV